LEKKMKATLQSEPRTDHERTPREYVSPVVNICETQEGYVLEAEMPGVNKEGLEIMLEGNELAIVGHRQTAVLPGQPLFRESNSADFRRVFELDPAIDTSRISAKVDQGVLTLTLPKSEKVKPRRIKVD
jgi:HSP20 family protein